MRSIGFLLLLLGAGSFVMHTMDMEFSLMTWVDKWGPDTGNIIRIGIAIAGLALVLLSLRKKKETAAEETEGGA